jgi:hypothetical protein
MEVNTETQSDNSAGTPGVHAKDGMERDGQISEQEILGRRSQNR